MDVSEDKPLNGGREGGDEFSENLESMGDVSDSDVASDAFLRDKTTVAKFRGSLNKEELLDYLHMKCINEVNMPIDAIQKKHLAMVGAHHNSGEAYADAEGLEDGNN